MRRMRFLMPVVLAGVVASLAVPGWTQSPEAGGTAEVLESARRDLEELRFEKALSTIEALLARPSLTEEERVAALILRSQAHVAYGDLEAAESDYRALLMLRPGYTPEESLTPPKAMARFAKVRGATVGTVSVVRVPEDAGLLFDGREVVVGDDGTFAAPVGEHRLEARRPGFDPLVIPVVVEAGKTVAVDVRLVPNSRTVVFRTEPDGVTVSLDGVEVGVTARPDDAPPGAAPFAELVVEHVALGEHAFGLSKRCHRPVVVRDILTVDLDDFAPKVYRPVSLEPVRSALTVSGGPEGAEVRVAGRRVGTVPLDAEPVCPGDAVVEVLWDERAIWRSVESLPADGARRVEVTPRPNVVLLGAERWPAGLDVLAGRANVLDIRPSAADEAMTGPEGWRHVSLPADADLAIAVLPPAEDGPADRWVAYGAWTRTVVRLDGIAPDVFERPGWRSGVAGVELADSRIGGDARVVSVAPSSPAAEAGLAVGDRVVAVGSGETPGARAASAALAVASGPVDVVVETAAGERRTVTLRPSTSPRVLTPGERAGARAPWLAAWAAVDSVVAEPSVRSTATANLALLLSDAGRHKAALEAWRRVRWGSRRGIGDGTAWYYVGLELLSLGREEEAEDAFRRAGVTPATTFTDAGPAVAPAAADHLADLGAEAVGR